ncbi:hypothetical protein BGX31_001179, partial [Mortierella sp. GBA43]
MATQELPATTATCLESSPRPNGSMASAYPTSNTPSTTAPTASHVSPGQSTAPSDNTTDVQKGLSNGNSNSAASKDPSTTATDSTPEPSAPSPAKDTTSTDSSDTALQMSDSESLVSRIMRREKKELGIIGVLVGSIAAHYLLPRIISWSSLLVGVLGMSIGGFVTAFYLLAVPEDTRLKRAQRIAAFGKHYERGFQIIDGVPSLSSMVEKVHDEAAKDKPMVETMDVEHKRVCISPDIDPMVEEIISFALRDFINEPLGLVSEGQHNIPLRSALVTMSMTVFNRLSNMRLPETALLGVFGLQNSFIVHLRAYRELRTSRLPIEEYVSKHANSNSVLGRCYRQEERVKQIRSIARDLCQSLLPKKDQQSMALFAVMQEIMAKLVLESTLELLCDPDYVNQLIIEYFSAPTNDKGAAGGASKGSSSAQTGDSKTDLENAPITSLADSILMNAAHLMGKKPEKQNTDADIISLPIRPATPDRSSLSSDGSAPEDADAIDRRAAVEIPKMPEVITLQQVLKYKNNHTQVFQEFMTYLQIWDAMDLAHFWQMVEVFHRQIEQGDLVGIEMVRREASGIYDAYCGPDPDQNLAGITEAKGGSLIKNLKKNMQRDPANCLKEPQEWALGVMETQYWVPFNIKQENERAKKAAEQQKVESPQTPPNDHMQESHTQEPPQTVSHDPSTSPILEPTNGPTDTPDSTPAVTSMPARPKMLSAQVTDMVNRKTKILMTSTDLAYMIEIQTEGDQGWAVTRTLQQLELLQSVIVNLFPGAQRTPFPRWRLQPSDKVCNGLQNYINSLLMIPEIGESPSLAYFLSKEFDQNPDGSAPGSANLGAGFMSAMSPISENTAAFGAAAAQGAKSALRQASEASMSAGRFFKSLGAAVGNGNSPQLSAEDRRGSFESERSIRSVGSALTLSDQRHMNGSLSSSMSRLQDMDVDGYSRPSFGNDRPALGRQTSFTSRFTRRSENLSSSSLNTVPQGPPPEPLANNAARAATHPVIRTDVTHKRTHSAVSPATAGSATLATPVSPTLAPLPGTTGAAPGPVAPIAPLPGTAPIAPIIEPVKKLSVPLLSNDELDLLIETSFTVLEDMMDFTKSQSIRRMTFGMLRELVRKSYRTAINQSFSAWVEENASHDKAVETVRWLKEDLLWPNGQWSPDSPSEQQPSVGDGEQSTTTATTTTTSGPAPQRTQEEKDATRDKARELVKVMLPGSLVTVLGKEAVRRGLVDVFEMFQIKELNQGLALSVLEMT